jgi:hypothetical protein
MPQRLRAFGLALFVGAPPRVIQSRGQLSPEFGLFAKHVCAACLGRLRGYARGCWATDSGLLLG